VGSVAQVMLNHLLQRTASPPAERQR
jgi:hypothetical protein